MIMLPCRPETCLQVWCVKELQLRKPLIIHMTGSTGTGHISESGDMETWRSRLT